MKRNETALGGAIALFLLGGYMIYLGLYSAPKTLVPPIVTGIGFFVIAWVFLSIRSRAR